MNQPRPSLLVIDDLPDWQATLKGVLGDAGYEVETAGSANEALNLVAHHTFDLAVIDVRLDETDEDNTEGISLAREIRTRQPAMKIVIITGYETTRTIEEALRPNKSSHRLAEAFVMKTDAEKLVEKVEAVLAR